MAAMMVVMVVLMMAGPHHGFMGPYIVSSPQAEAPYMQIDRTGRPEQYKP